MDTVEYIELFWDCPECEQRHISAVFNPQGNRCPSCLHWRTNDVPLYESSDSQVITDPALINRKPFWVCKVCHAVNQDVGLAAHLLQCENCNSYQTSAVGGVTGDLAVDQQAPNTVAVGEPVVFQPHAANQPVPAASTPQPPTSRTGRLIRKLTWFNLIGGGILASLAIASQLAVQFRDPSLLDIQVNDLVWTVSVDVQTQKTVTRQAWDEALPAGAAVIKSERRQRGTRQEQRGTRTVMVQEQYQSDTRTETYTTSEQYQSGTRTETYTESERYQSGTRTETYTTSERYQSGTDQECRTTSRGNGLGERRCRSVPVYSTRQVPHTRSVPVYSTRQVSRTRSVPVYSTRQVPHTRTVPIYSTRQVPVQQPIMVTIPVYDQWITYQVKEWEPQQTRRQTGHDDAPRRAPNIRLSQQPPQRIAATHTECRLYGTYSIHHGWFQPPELKTGIWTLPCEDYDRIDIGNQVQLRATDSDLANLVRLL
ncbi:MAG TPA: hypothetical protein V6C78_33625 [Crinalium sp.]|jgi:hypothetical protein